MTTDGTSIPEEDSSLEQVRWALRSLASSPPRPMPKTFYLTILGKASKTSSVLLLASLEEDEGMFYCSYECPRRELVHGLLHNLPQVSEAETVIDGETNRDILGPSLSDDDKEMILLGTGRAWMAAFLAWATEHRSDPNRIGDITERGTSGTAVGATFNVAFTNKHVQHVFAELYTPPTHTRDPADDSAANSEGHPPGATSMVVRRSDAIAANQGDKAVVFWGN